MFKRVMIAAMFICPPVFAQELTNFKAITDDLAVGKEIVVVMDNSRCSVNNPNNFEFPLNTITAKPSIVVFNDKHLTFDGVKFAHGEPMLPANGILERTAFSLDAEGRTNATLAIFDPVTNKKISGFDDVKIQCELGKGVHVYQR